MSDFILRIFIKDYKTADKSAIRERVGVASSIVGVLVNLILAAIKLIAGLLSFSVAIIADALNNLSDAGSSIVSFISFKIAGKPADRDHPFGHARIEYICSMIVSFLILLVGVELLSESFSGFFEASEPSYNFSAVTFIILGISIFLKLWLSLFYFRVSKKIDSSVIKASCYDSLFDSISTFAVLVSSIIIYYSGFWYIDSIVGIGVSGLVLFAGIKLLLETKNSLLGEAPVDGVIEQINETVAKYDEVIGIHDMMVHNYGPKHYFASFHAEVDGSKDINYLHDIIDNIEREINDVLGIICTIHMDPIATKDERVNELRAFVLRIVKTVCDIADIHDFRVVIGQTHTNLIFDILIPFEVRRDVNEITDEIKALVSSERPDCYCVMTVDRG